MILSLRSYSSVAFLFAALMLCPPRSSTSAQAVLGESSVPLPRTSLADAAFQYAKANEPNFLLNHSLRTFVFGSLHARMDHLKYDPETLFVAALFHDAGLLPKFATRQGSFEIDGADLAEAYVKSHGGSAEQARIIWNAIALHDVARAIKRHQTNEAVLIGAGAAMDVDGAESMLPHSEIVPVIALYPRLNFKREFLALVTDHCKRKPSSQVGWLASHCQAVAPHNDEGSVTEEIMSAPYPE